MALPEIVLFEDRDFKGSEWRTNLREVRAIADYWKNDVISSIIVVSGIWEFFENNDFGGARSHKIGPGYYPWVEDSPVNLCNDCISSFRCVSPP